jgi:mRNA interferase MazF
MTFPPKIDIWRADLGSSKGHEQERERPVLVWKDLDHVKMAIIIPFTTSPKREDLPYTHLVSPSSKNGLTEESVALVFQIRALDKRRLAKKFGELEEKEIFAIGNILKDLLKL